MAGKGPSHAPLSYRDHLRIRAATKHLHSRFVSVRNAAHKEIQRILGRRQEARGRLDPRKLARQAWDRVNHGRKHECGNCEYGTRDRAMLRRHQEGHMREAARSNGPAATPGLRERTDPAGARVHDPDVRRQERTRDPVRSQARTQDIRRQSGLLPGSDRKPGPWSGRVGPQPQAAPTRQPKPASRPAPWPTTPNGLSVPPHGRPVPKVARSPRVPAAPAAPSAARTPPLPHETARAPRARGKGLRMPRLRARA